MKTLKPLSSATITKLARAVERLEKEGQHCIGSFAVDEHGYEVSPKSPKAVAWCALGAMAK